jgi:hypothetical protein
MLTRGHYSGFAADVFRPNYGFPGLLCRSTIDVPLGCRSLRQIS